MPLLEYESLLSIKTVDASLSNSFLRPVMLPRRKEYGHGTSNDLRCLAGLRIRGPIHKKIKCNEKCNENCNRMEFDSETYPNFSISPFHYIIFGPCESGM